MIKDLGEIPYCNDGCGKKVNANPRYYLVYKRKGYPKSLPGHNNTGKPAWNKNLTKESDLRVAKYSEITSEKLLEWHKTHKHPRLGSHPIAWNKGIKTNKPAWNSGTKGICKPNSGSRKKGCVSPNKGKKSSLQTKEKLSKAQINAYKNNPQLKINKRIARIEQARANNGIYHPAYNPRSCEYFKSFDEQNNTQGKYAMYGGEEHHIEELGYFPDYINFDLKIIMEWDEEYHYENDILSERDIQRQIEIQKFYPDFEFRRIREKDIIK